jgi:6-pyruvoyltetrahydropterin/6-carboxytetrahydropterin synthase
MEICKSVEFAAAHRLMGHESRCQYPHGHNYKVDIFVTGDERSLDKVGRIVDFKIIKEGLGKWIDEMWDHCFIYNSRDEISCEIVDVLKKYNKDERVYKFIEKNPTAENMCVELAEVVARNDKLWNGIDYFISKIRVWETNTAFAEIEVEY